jgi:sugar lactone lactonase YvrE
MYGAGGEPRGEVGGAGSGWPGFDGWVDVVAVGPDGTVYVGDTWSVHLFDADGTFRTRWEGPFSKAGGVAVRSDGTVFVTDHGPYAYAHRLLWLAADGSPLGEWGMLGHAVGQFWHPHGVAIGPDETVYVADTENLRIQRFRLA